MATYWWYRFWRTAVTVLVTVLGCCGALTGTVPDTDSGEDGQISDLCVNQTLEWTTALRAAEDWALRMQDATGRPGPGVLLKRLTWLGSYDQCRNTLPTPSKQGSTTPSTRWSPHYCLAAITLQQFDTEVTRVGLCFPDGCSGSDVLAYMRKHGGFIGLDELKLKVKSIDQVTCQTHDPRWSSATVALIVFLCFLGAVTVFATLYHVAVVVKFPSKAAIEGPNDLANLLRSQSSTSSNVSEYTMLLNRPITPRQPDQSRMRKIMRCFSLKSSMDRLLHSHTTSSSRRRYEDEGQGQEDDLPDVLPCLHGLRALSMLWVIEGHTNYFATKIPTANLEEAWDKLRKKLYFQATVNSFLAGDTFLLISGLLVSYLSFKYMERHRTRFNLLHFYCHRLLRITPVYMLVLVLVMFLVPHLGDGPLWTELSTMTAHCDSHWWTNLFYVNNLVYSDRMCMEWSWYLANDMQFYLLAPVFILTIYLFSSAEYLQRYYIKPYCRASPYIIGILTGYLLYSTRCLLEMKQTVKVPTSIIAAVSCLSLIFGTMAAANGATVSQSAVSFYFAVSHVIWSLAIAWLVILCCTNNGGVVSTLLSWRGWVPFSRLSLCIYLIHPVVIMVHYLTLRTPFFISRFSLSFAFIGNTVFSVASALIIYLGFESPVMALKQLCWNR